MKVMPKSDDVRKYIAHPSAGPFRPEGPADWPADQFTFRLIEDGTLTIADEDNPAEDAAAPAQETVPPAQESVPPPAEQLTPEQPEEPTTQPPTPAQNP